MECQLMYTALDVEKDFSLLMPNGSIFYNLQEYESYPGFRNEGFIVWYMLSKTCITLYVIQV